MDAFILAAGLGTRLRPLTDHTPKALIEVGGVPMLERVARRLIAAGADRLIINVHHLADQIVQFVETQNGFGVEVCISEEPEQRLETGGGLLHAQGFFRKDRPFFIHNADILTEIDLEALYAAHEHSDALAMLAVRPAETSRYLVQAEGLICGYGNAEKGTEHLARQPQGRADRVDFLGVQVVSHRIFGLLTETGVFSIFDPYYRLIRQGEAIRAYPAEDALWIDIGSHERLEEARRAVEAAG